MTITNYSTGQAVRFPHQGDHHAFNQGLDHNLTTVLKDATGVVQAVRHNGLTSVRLDSSGIIVTVKPGYLEAVR